MTLPLVLIHGHPFDHTMWNPQIEAFSPTRRVIAPDLRGYGTSPAVPAVPEAAAAPAVPAAATVPAVPEAAAVPAVPGITLLSDFAQDIAALLDELRVETFVLAGLSMGGQIAMECYRQFPDRIRGLVLADTFAAPETPDGRLARNHMADRLLAEGMTGYADEVLEKMVAPYADPAVKAHVHRMMTATSPEGAAAALRGRAERPDYRPLLTRVTVPALVVVGEDDEYTPVSDAAALHAALPDSELQVIARAAHLPNLERAAEFNRVLADFLAKVEA